MLKTKAIIGMLRLPNLVIVLLSQCLPYVLILWPAILKSGGVPVLTEKSLLLISIGTVVCTLAGYLINDFFDREIDLANKPDRAVIGKYLSATTVLIVYVLLTLSALYLGYWLDKNYFPLHNDLFLRLFGVVSFLLWLYARALKCTPFLGNLLVALLCAIVPLVVIWPENRTLHITAFQSPTEIQRAINTIWYYVFFAFVTTLFREMVKDIEDFEGDAACKCNTLPVIKGVRFAQKWAFLAGILLLIVLGLLVFSWHQSNSSYLKVSAGILCLILPALFACERTLTGKTKKDFGHASLAIKFIMLAGLILLLL